MTIRLLRADVRRRAGHSLLETLMVVAVAGVLLSGAAMGYHSRLPSYRLSNAARHVVSDLRLARSRAVSLNVPVIVSVSAATEYVIGIDADDDGAIDPDEARTRELVGVLLAASPTSGLFRTSGTFDASGGALEIELTASEAGSADICVLPSGQIVWYCPD